MKRARRNNYHCRKARERSKPQGVRLTKPKRGALTDKEWSMQDALLRFEERNNLITFEEFRFKIIALNARYLAGNFKKGCYPVTLR